MHIYASFTMVSSFFEATNYADCLNSSMFDFKVHLMALELSYKARTQSSFSIRPSMMLTQMVIAHVIYYRVLFEILPCSGLGR